METQLHHELKLRYACDVAQTEVVIDSYRIDAIASSGELVEIQHASLGALRRKTIALLESNKKRRLRIVKPIVARKWITTLDPETEQPLRRRLSPKRCSEIDLFQDLVHFVSVFPHPRLTLDVVLVDLEEVRLPKEHHRFRRKNYVALEQQLLAIGKSVSLRRASDLWKLLPEVSLPRPFCTAILAKAVDRPRWFAQKIAYCLKHSGAVKQVGKSGNSHLFLRPVVRRPAKAG